MSWIFEVGDIDPKELEEETHFAELFLRAGGHLTRSDWAELDTTDLMALVRAGDQLQLERTLQLVQGLSGPQGVAALLQPVDQGELSMRVAMLKAAERLRHAQTS